MYLEGVVILTSKFVADVTGDRLYFLRFALRALGLAKQGHGSCTFFATVPYGKNLAHS